MFTASRLGAIILGLAAILVSFPVAAADEPASLDCQALIEQLDSPDFASRQEASRQLAEAGTDAIPVLETTAASGSREASVRALELLQRQFQRGSEESKTIVREALARLADSKDARTAQRARDVLTPPVERTAMTPWGGVPNFPNNNGLRGNNFQLQIGGNAAGIARGVRRVSYSEINGRRGVEITEEDRTVTIETSPAGSIQIDITERLNGREVTRTITARSRDELVRRDAETAKLYDLFHRPGGPVPGLPPGFGFENPGRFGNRALLR